MLRSTGTWLIGIVLAIAACHERSTVRQLDPARCGTSGLTGVSWTNDVGWVGVGVVAVGGFGYYGGWYDPGDTYDPATGEVSGGDDSYYGVPTDDGETNGSTDDGTDDTSSDDDDAPAADTTMSLNPLTSNAINGCYGCTIGCTATDANGQRVGQQAEGVSDASYDDACRSAVEALGTWAHTALQRPLDSCQPMDAPAAADAGTTTADAGTNRVAASPTVAR